MRRFPFVAALLVVCFFSCGFAETNQSYQGPKIDLQFLAKEGWLLDEEVYKEDYFSQGWISQDGMQYVTIESSLQEQDDPQTIKKMYIDFWADSRKLHDLVEFIEVNENDMLIICKDPLITLVMKLIVTPVAIHSLSYCENRPCCEESAQRGCLLLSEVKYEI